MYLSLNSSGRFTNETRVTNFSFLCRRAISFYNPLTYLLICSLTLLEYETRGKPFRVNHVLLPSQYQKIARPFSGFISSFLNHPDCLRHLQYARSTTPRHYLFDFHPGRKFRLCFLFFFNMDIQKHLRINTDIHTEIHKVTEIYTLIRSSTRSFRIILLCQSHRLETLRG